MHYNLINYLVNKRKVFYHRVVINNLADTIREEEDIVGIAKEGGIVKFGDIVKGIVKVGIEVVGLVHLEYINLTFFTFFFLLLNLFNYCKTQVLLFLYL